MALTGAAYPFGLREVVLTPIVDSVLETLGTPIKLPASRTFTFTEAEDYVELRGDDRLLLSRGMGPFVEWELEGGGIDLDVFNVIIGGTLTNTGVTPNQIRKVAKKTTDSRPYFRVEGRAIGDTGGDIHGLVYRCRATSNSELTFQDGEFFMTNAEGKGYGSLAVATLDALYDIIQNETPDQII